MTLSPGARLGAYEIVGLLGAGGMGEVYRARDTRLDRTVALKILPETLAGDPAFRERFDREARALSQLDHPHICALHDVGEHTGTAYLVMQYLESETLAARLERGALPLAEALTIAIQIAGALDAAHRAGIVHRDPKPGNVMLVRRGGVSGPPEAKLLDFGLAKATAPVVAGAGLTMAPTTPAALTQQGTILGTFQYMAPEQLEGGEADARTDIFAFGALLFEMLTGVKAFEGKSHAGLIGAIMHADAPSVSSAGAVAPASLDRIVRKCLAKQPDDRWQSAHDLRDALSWIADERVASTIQTAAPPLPAASRQTRHRAVLVAAAVGLVALGAAAAALIRPSATPAPVVRLHVSAPDKTTFVSPPGSVAGANGGTISPDGRRLVFTVRNAAGVAQLWIRSRDEVTAVPLAGTDEPGFPFWSPDSRFVGFFAAGRLRRVPVDGGPAQTIVEVKDGARGASWGTAGTIVFATLSGLYSVPAEGGEPRAILKSAGESATWPAFLPDGRHFIYVRARGNTGGAVHVGSIESGDVKRVVASDSNALYAEPGFIWYMREGTLLRQPFDAEALEVRGEPAPVAEQVSFAGQTPLGAFSVSGAGVLTYRALTATSTRFGWFDRRGQLVEWVGPVGTYLHPALSPDGSRLAFTRLDQQASGDIWLLDIMRQTMSRFTFAAAQDYFPVWSPDDSQVLYQSAQGGSLALYTRNASGTGAEQRVLDITGAGVLVPAQWSADNLLLFFRSPGLDIFAAPMTGERKPAAVITGPFQEGEPQRSPDGR